jgi:hypothetical protein
MRRFLYNQVARPLAFGLPVAIVFRTVAPDLGLVQTWALVVATLVFNGLTDSFFPYVKKATPKGNENAKR